MAYDRYPRGNAFQGDYFGRDDDDYRQRAGRDPSYGGAGDYEAARGGRFDRDDRARGEFDRGYYSRGRGGDFGGGSYGYGDQNRSYGGDRSRSFEPRGQRDDRDYRYQDRGFFDRAGDEVRSWFGDEEAERRRTLDQRYDQRHAQDDHYHSWRSSQIAALDRDYDEYRRENQQRFSNEFGTWRTDRQGQRSSLERVNEHMDVVGSDGEHVGTVDKVRGDRILLTKSDPDAGGRHHSVPSRWIQSVDDKVTLRKTADEAKGHWRDEERSAFFGGDSAGTGEEAGSDGRILNRSFSGTY